MQALAKTEIPRGLTSTGLKTIALVLMVLDHIHYFFGFTGWIPEWFSTPPISMCSMPSPVDCMLC